jgi:uncharacterized protein (UPF0333 family)
MYRKGQAALEFMMTYGWAILVVLAASGALAYFGVFNTTKYVPEICMASSGFSCQGKPLLTVNSVAFTITNGAGYNLNLNTAGMNLSASLASCVNKYICAKGNTACTTTTYSLDDGASATIVLSGCAFTNNIVKGDIRQSYPNPNSGLNEFMTVTFTGKY